MAGMGKREFVRRSRLVHGNKYDYSEVVYGKDCRDPVIIYCKKHKKRFKQNPIDHYSGHGCPLCNKHRSIGNKREFVRRAREVWGDRYDYSQVEWDGQTQVMIVCREHGPFPQTPNDHLDRHGCPKCHRFRRLGKEGFVRKSQAIWGDRYDYTETDYTTPTKKVRIVCREHGPFEQQANNHMHGSQGCRGCTDAQGRQHQIARKKVIVAGLKAGYCSKGIADLLLLKGIPAPFKTVHVVAWACARELGLGKRAGRPLCPCASCQVTRAERHINAEFKRITLKQKRERDSKPPVR